MRSQQEVRSRLHQSDNYDAFLTILFFVTVTCTVNARKVTIKGKRGEVTKNFSHVACELKKMKQDSKKRSGTYIRIRIWFGGYKQSCAVNTLKSHISNMIIGVTEVSLRSTIAICPAPPVRCDVYGFGAPFLVLFN